MIMIYTFDQSGLSKAALVENYESLIWTKRFFVPGDCELYLPATSAMIELIKPGVYIVRDDDEMICRVTKVELHTSVENGDHLVVAGEDAKAILDQRIIWNTATCYGNLETFIRKLVTDNLVSPAKTERAFPGLILGTALGLTKRLSEQVSFVNLGEKIREYCRAYGFGYQITRSGANLVFNLTEGEDKTASVVFCEDYENLEKSSYIQDTTDASNVALIAGEGEGAARARAVYGYAAGAERREKFVDQRDLGSDTTYDELIQAYPPTSAGGTGYIDGTDYKLGTCVIHVYDGNQKAWLDDNYPGGTYGTAADGSMTYTLTDVAIAELPSSTPDTYDAVRYKDLIYSMWMAAAGAESIEAVGSLESFTGQIVPDVTFTYGVDYKLGDIVTVRNSYGIEAQARVVEVLDYEDVNGHKVEPAFEYLSNDSSTTVPAGSEELYTGSASLLQEKVNTTESGKILTLTNTNVRFENGLEFARARTTKAPDSLSGTQLGSTGFYKYTVTLNITGRGMYALTRPVVVCDVRLNDLGIGVPGYAYVNGSSQPFETATVTFYYPAATLTGTVTVEQIWSYINTEDLTPDTDVTVTQDAQTGDLTII